MQMTKRKKKSEQMLKTEDMEIQDLITWQRCPQILLNTLSQTCERGWL